MNNKNIVVLFVIPLLLTSCSPKRGPREHEKRFTDIDEFYEEPKIEDSKNIIIDPTNVKLNEYEIHDEIQYAYLNSGYNKVSKFAEGTKELSKARYLTLQVREEIEEVEEFYIELSEFENFEDSIIYQTASNSVDVTNLKVGTTYYYRGSDELDGLDSSFIDSFTTENTLPRNLNIDGTTNVRDIGGYKSKLGGRIRQGLYYRGARLSVSNVSEYKAQISEKGYKQLVEELRLKTEIDLRMNPSHHCENRANEYGGMNNSIFKDIEYEPVPLDYSYSNLMDKEKEQIGKIFKLLAKKSTFPVYLHCDIGTDRTGMCSYLLGTLLGIPQENLFRDYLFSNFGNIGSSRNLKAIKEKYLPYLRTYREKNLYLDVRDYLNDCGVSNDELDTIIRIFLEVGDYE